MYLLVMATAKTDKEDGTTCPVCLGQFNIPRQLPCAHNFCQSCLQSYITTEATKFSELKYIKCPICTQTASPSVKDKPTIEWASLFPANTLLESILPTKSKVDRLCDACNSECVSVSAEGFCVVCKEAMCADCLRVHRKQKMSKNHTIFSVEELADNPQNVMKLGEDLCCSEHEGEYLKFYCKDHKVAGCGTCFFHNHNACSNKIDFKEKLSALLREIKPDGIIAEMEKIESHLQKFMELNESSVSDLESQINELTEQIREIRRKINSLLDDLETRLKTEGSRIYKEEAIKKQEENHKCLSMIHAVRNSYALFKTVNTYGSEIQTFLMADKMVPQLHSYSDLVREKFETTDTITLKVELLPQIESILSLSVTDVGKLVTTKSSRTLPSCFRKPTKDCRFERVDVIDLKVPVIVDPWYTGVAFLPGDRVMLADHNNKHCILLSSSYQFITSLTLTMTPLDICVLDDREVAVSMYGQNKIQILSIKDHVISPVRTITTIYTCDGIAATGKGEMVVNSGVNGYWSLMSTAGEVKASHQYGHGTGQFNYIALNNAKTRVYVSTHSMHSLRCFDMDGKNQFTYSPENLKYPIGVAVDRDDNIYVLGFNSYNIHQLSPDGSAIQMITSGVPANPCAMSYNKCRDMFIVTSFTDKRKLHIYQLK